MKTLLSYALLSLAVMAAIVLVGAVAFCLAIPAFQSIMRVPTPDNLRRRVLQLDMHDLPAAEIAQRTGIRQGTVESIISRMRPWRKEQWRGDNVLLHDPAGILPPGARFNLPDLKSMVEFSGLVDGTLFEIARRDGSVYRAEVRDGELVRCQ